MTNTELDITLEGFKAMLLDAERELVEACVLLSDGYDLALLPKQSELERRTS